ncbi:hypothetical protein BDZ45DRAFT_803661 [Acephala macrosclerotiorum]|nr:hypothetical protein BDZ45DRAFT_803661 [Acephala macrosclerotiorum]
MGRITVQSLPNRDPPSPECSTGDPDNLFKNRKPVSAPKLPPMPAPEPQHQFKDRHSGEEVGTPIESTIGDEDIEAAGILMQLSTDNSGWKADDFDAAETMLQLKYQAMVFTSRPMFEPGNTRAIARSRASATRDQDCRNDNTVSEHAAISSISHEPRLKRQCLDEKLPLQHQLLQQRLILQLQARQYARQQQHAQQQQQVHQRLNARQKPSACERPSLAPLRMTATRDFTRDETKDDKTPTPDDSPEHSPKTPNLIRPRRRSIAYSPDFPSGLSIVVNDSDSDSDSDKPLPLGPRRKGSSTRLRLEKTTIKKP